MLPPGFETALDIDPDDHVTRLVAADWLDENDRSDEADALRVQAALGLRPARAFGRFAAGGPRGEVWAWVSHPFGFFAGNEAILFGYAEEDELRLTLEEKQRLNGEQTDRAERARVPITMLSAFYVVASRWVWPTRAEADAAWRSAWLNMSAAAKEHMLGLAGLASRSVT